MTNSRVPAAAGGAAATCSELQAHCSGYQEQHLAANMEAACIKYIIRKEVFLERQASHPSCSLGSRDESFMPLSTVGVRSEYLKGLEFWRAPWPSNQDPCRELHACKQAFLERSLPRGLVRVKA